MKEFDRFFEYHIDENEKDHYVENFFKSTVRETDNVT